jgi:hypothetical protein
VRLRLKLILAALAMVMVLYGSSVGFGFVRASEEALAEAMRSADVLTLLDAPTSDLSRLNVESVGFRADWQPLVALSYVIDGLTGGGAPWSFHLTNLLLLALLGAAAASRVSGAARWLVLALVVAHPMQTAAVMDVSARGELLLALFGTLAVVLRGRWSPACAFLAMASHPVGVVVPFFAVAAARKRGPHQRRRLWSHLAALVAWLGARFGLGLAGVVPTSPFWGSAESAQAAAASAWVFLSTLLVPAEPVFSRSPMIFDGEIMAIAWVGLLMVALLLVRVRAVADMPGPAFGFGLLIVPLLLGSGLLSGTDGYSESRLCWPIVGLAWILVSRPTIQGIGVAMVPIWVGLAVLRAGDWASSSTLWEKSYASVSSDMMIAHHLGRSLQHSDPTRAVGLLQQATHDYDHPQRRLRSHRLLVGIYQGLGKDRRALPHLAHVANPRESGNEDLLALRCKLETRFGVSERDYPHGMVSAPLSQVCGAAARYYSADAALQNAAGMEAAVRGDYDAATGFFRLAVELDPDNGQFRRDLAQLPTATMGWGLGDPLSPDPSAAP